jgi:hypothetical protein
MNRFKIMAYHPIDLWKPIALTETLESAKSVVDFVRECCGFKCKIHSPDGRVVYEDTICTHNWKSEGF